LIAIARLRHRYQPARPPLAEGILPAHLLDSRLQGYELQPFFLITDCRASLSKLRSATSFRSFVFSSRSCLASCAWLTSMPPYFAFQAYSVCLDTPTSRATSSTFRPASTCFSAPIICASVCLLFDIPRSPFFRTNHTQLCAETGEQVTLANSFAVFAHTIGPIAVVYPRSDRALRFQYAKQTFE